MIEEIVGMIILINIAGCIIFCLRTDGEQERLLPYDFRVKHLFLIFFLPTLIIIGFAWLIIWFIYVLKIKKLLNKKLF